MTDTPAGASQDMWLIEGALEVHLGEFHVRMKGTTHMSRCFLGLLWFVGRGGCGGAGQSPRVGSSAGFCA